jgi:hypothetical protein
MPAVTDPPRPNGRRHPDQRNIGQFIATDHPGGILFAVRHRHHDLVRMTDHVIVGHDQPGRVDDKAGAGAHRLFAAVVAEATAELTSQRRVAQFRRQFGEHFAA